MEASVSVSQLHSFTCSCNKGSAAGASASPRAAGSRLSLARQRVKSNSLAGSRQELGTPLRFNLKESRSRLPSTTRCLYSPLVESYKPAKTERLTKTTDGNEGGPVLTSPASLSFIKPSGLGTLSEQGIVVEEDLHRDDNEKGSVKDFPSPQDPIAAAHGDSSLLVTSSDTGRDINARRSARYQPQTMSLTHGFRSAANQGVSCAIGVVGRPDPLANTTKIGGPVGLMMGLAVAGLGIATTIQKASETQPLKKLCTRCDGYGVECCDVCGGVGQIVWEGKVHRKNPCPQCFGSRLKKCPRCDGCRSKKDSTPVLLHLKNPAKKK